jgi:hypothetical protein
LIGRNSRFPVLIDEIKMAEDGWQMSEVREDKGQKTGKRRGKIGNRKAINHITVNREPDNLSSYHLFFLLRFP